MIERKGFFIIFGIVFGVITLFYTGVYFSAKNNTGDAISEEYISDISNVSQDKLNLIKQYSTYYELDSNGNFNPQNSLSRIDAIKVIDKIAKQVLSQYNTTKPSIVPYFEDFKSSDSNSDAILRVVNLIDTKEDFYKHYNILGYKLNRQDAITHREFLNLLAVFIPVNKDLGDDYVLKNLLNYGFDLNVDLNSELSREDSVVYIDKILKSIR